MFNPVLGNPKHGGRGGERPFRMSAYNETIVPTIPLKHEPPPPIRSHSLVFTHQMLWSAVVLYFGTTFALIAVEASAPFMWIIMLQIGYVYTKIVMLATFEQRFTIDYLKLYFLGLIAWWLGPQWTFVINTFQQITKIIVIVEGLGFAPVTIPGTFWTFVGYTMVAYMLPYFVGLHLPFWPRFLRKSIVVKTLVGIAVGGYHVWLFIDTGIWLWYTVGYSTLFLILALLYGTRLRVHYYHWALLLFSLTRFQNVISAVVQGLCAGVMTYGVAKNDFRMPFVRDGDEESDDAEQGSVICIL